MTSVPSRRAPQVAGPNLVNIEVMRNRSELFRAVCSKLISGTEKQCKGMQNGDNMRLGQRVKDIQFMKAELEQRLGDILVEIEELVALQNRVTKGLEACKEPLRVTNLCLEERMKHCPSDRRQDEVDRQLLDEKEIFEGVVCILQRVVEQITEQIRMNRRVTHILEQDLKEKSEAQCIDNSCSLMTTHTMNNLPRPPNNKTVLQSFAVTPMEWEKMSDVNLAKADKQKDGSASLRALVDSILEQTSGDMQKQVQATTEAFQLNIQEIRSAKSQMEDELAKILPELNSQQRIRDDLLGSITENQDALNLARSRLALRHQRPAKEQCHDQAQSHLLSEVQQLAAHIRILREAVVRSEEKQRLLVRSQRELQENIRMKAHSLYIDEVVCSQLRELVVIHGF